MKTILISLAVTAALASIAAGADSPLSKGEEAVRAGKAAMQAGDTETAAASFRAAQSHFGSPALTYPPASYGKLAGAHTHPEAFATLKQADIGYLLGSKRVAKGAYRVVLERFPDLHSKRNGALLPMRKQLCAVYAQLCRATGDYETADRYDPVIVEDWGRTPSEKVRLMNQAARDGKWEEAIALAQEVMQDAERTGAADVCVRARLVRIIAYLELKRYEEVMGECEALLADGGPRLEDVSADPEVRLLWRRQLGYFRIHACHKLGDYAKCAELCAQYLEEHPDDSRYALAVYSLYMDSLLQQGVEENAPAVLLLCGKLLSLWPEHESVPRVCSSLLDDLAGSGKVTESAVYRGLNVASRSRLAEICVRSGVDSRRGEAMEIYKELADSDFMGFRDYFQRIGAPAVERLVELGMQSGDYAVAMDPVVVYYLYCAIFRFGPHPKAEQVCRCIVDAAAATGDYDRAEKLFRMLLETAESNPDADVSFVRAQLERLLQKKAADGGQGGSHTQFSGAE